MRQLISARRCAVSRTWRKPRKGANPVPGPTMMIGVSVAGGSLKLECRTYTGTEAPMCAAIFVFNPDIRIRLHRAAQQDPLMLAPKHSTAEQHSNSQVSHSMSTGACRQHT